MVSSNISLFAQSVRDRLLNLISWAKSVPGIEIGAFRSLKSDCTKRRHGRRRGWCQNVGRSFFYHKLRLEHLSNHTYSLNSKKSKARISKTSFFAFKSELRETKRLRNLKKSV